MEHWYIGFRTVGSIDHVINKIKNSNLSHILSSHLCYEKRVKKGEFYFFVGVNTARKPEDDEEITNDLREILNQLGLRNLGIYVYFDDIKKMAKEVEVNSVRKLKIYSHEQQPVDPFSYIESEGEIITETQTLEAYQDLLYIMSLYGKGTWQSFRDLCGATGLDSTGLKSKQIMRHLRLLGHVELINHGRDWVVAPPCLVQPDINPNNQSGYTVFLAGQRSKSIINSLAYYVHTIEPHPYKNAPECIYIHFDNQEEAQEFAYKHHYHQVGTVARTMVEQLPTLDEWESLLSSQLIVTAHYNFSEWRDGMFTPLEGLPQKTGLYELTPRNNTSHIPKQTLYYDASREQWLKTDWYGLRYLMLKRTGQNPKIYYHLQENIVMIHKNHLLPYLYEKALVLASGCLPTYRGQFICYSGISLGTIRGLSDKLEAELVEHKDDK